MIFYCNATVYGYQYFYITNHEALTRIQQLMSQAYRFCAEVLARLRKCKSSRRSGSLLCTWVVSFKSVSLAQMRNQHSVHAVKNFRSGEKGVVHLPQWFNITPPHWICLC